MGFYGNPYDYVHFPALSDANMLNEEVPEFLISTHKHMDIKTAKYAKQG